jgi:hypothetical protein
LGAVFFSAVFLTTGLVAAGFLMTGLGAGDSTGFEDFGAGAGFAGVAGFEGAVAFGDGGGEAAGAFTGGAGVFEVLPIG